MHACTNCLGTQCWRIITLQPYEHIRENKEMKWSDLASVIRVYLHLHLWIWKTETASFVLYIIRLSDTLCSSITFQWKLDKCQIEDELLPGGVIPSGLFKLQHLLLNCRMIRKIIVYKLILACFESVLNFLDTVWMFRGIIFLATCTFFCVLYIVIHDLITLVCSTTASYIHWQSHHGSCWLSLESSVLLGHLWSWTEKIKYNKLWWQQLMFIIDCLFRFVDLSFTWRKQLSKIMITVNDHHSPE